MRREDSRQQWEVDQATQLNRALDLANIMPIALTATVLAAAPEHPNWSYALELEPVRWSVNGGGVAGRYRVSVQIQDGASNHALATLRVTFAAGYAFSDQYQGELEGCLPHFLGIVGWMHVWPYIRSEIQELSVKLGYPALTLPMLQPGQTASVDVVRDVDERAGAAADEGEGEA